MKPNQNQSDTEPTGNLNYFTQPSEGIKGEGCPSSSTSPPDIRVDSCPLAVTSPSDFPPPDETDQQSFDRLARLSLAEYDRARRAEAKRLGIRIETLDTEVARRRPDVNYDAQARAVKLPQLEPWPEPVDGAEVLDQISARFTLHVVLPRGAADAITLWDAHAHAFDAFLHTPRLNLSSPKAQCGKTTTLDLIATMTPRALRTENLTAPVLFRLVDQHQPTLLLDEVDAYLTYSEELRGLLNAGHKQGACAYRCEGEGNSVRAFKAFGPAVLSGIGALPDTLHDRSVRVLLLRAQPGQVTTHFDSRHKEIETVLCRKLARWAQDNWAKLQACDPVMPPDAYNRVADNWRPLFAIAEIAGGDWPRRALEAFNNLNTRRPASDTTELETSNAQPPDSAAIELLAAIRQIFTQTGVTRMSSKQLVDALRARSASHPSLSASGGEGRGEVVAKLDPASLARQLHPFGIKPHNIRLAALRAKGYDLTDFTEAFKQFLDQAP